jgi:hypothetical protein
MTAHRSRTALVFVAIVAIVFDLGGFQIRGRAQDRGSGFIPKQGDGYSISQPPVPAQKAPPGFEGQTDTSTLTAVGDIPATTGKKVVARFKFSNKIRTCPDADGTADGEGEYSVTVDSTDENTNRTDHFEMRARAKYKGKVNDDAWLDGPVKAEIDYTASGGNAQHVTIPFMVSRGLDSPSFGPFSGGDPSHGRVSEAYDVGIGLAYWAGIYYGVAQLNWRTGQCAEISYDPPSRTMRPPPGTEAKVTARLKSKRGEIVRAHFQEVHAFADGSVRPIDAWSTETLPVTFTYTAGTRKSPPTGFEAGATSRAGIAQAAWDATLGTNWSGRIECSHIMESAANDEQHQSSLSSATRYAVEVEDGRGRARGYSDQNAFSQTLRPVARGGYTFDTSQSMSGSAQDEKAARVVVNLNTTKGTYSIQAEHLPFAPGTMHSETCDYIHGCFEQTGNFYVDSCLTAGVLSGEFNNPNEVSGSFDVVAAGLGAFRNRPGKETWSITWHLSRQGTTR